MEDLFENFEALPMNVQQIIADNSPTETCESCKKMQTELLAVGYACEFSLDCQPFNLKNCKI